VFINCNMYVRLCVCMSMRHSYVILLWFAHENYILKLVYETGCEYWDMMYSRGISWSYMICARVCIMYYIYCVLIYWFIVCINFVLLDYVWLCVHCMCMFICTLSGVYCYFLYQAVAFWNVYIVKKWMWRCVKFPFILHPQGGRCQVGCCLESWHTCLASCLCAPGVYFSLQRAAYVYMSQRYPVYLHAAVCRVNYSACLDAAIFVLANQGVWRLFCQVRLCYCLLVESDWSLVVERWFE